MGAQHFEDEPNLPLNLQQPGALGLEGALRPGKLVGRHRLSELSSCLSVRPACPGETALDVVLEIGREGERQMAELGGAQVSRALIEQPSGDPLLEFRGAPGGRPRGQPGGTKRVMNREATEVRTGGCRRGGSSRPRPAYRSAPGLGS